MPTPPPQPWLTYWVCHVKLLLVCPIFLMCELSLLFHTFKRKTTKAPSGRQCPGAFHRSNRG